MLQISQLIKILNDSSLDIDNSLFADIRWSSTMPVIKINTRCEYLRCLYGRISYSESPCSLLILVAEDALILAF